MNPVAITGSQCEGVVTGTATAMTINGIPVALVGDEVSPHGESPHDNVILIEHPPAVPICLTVNGIAVCRVGSPASCGHAVTTGSPACTIP